MNGNNTPRIVPSDIPEVCTPACASVTEPPPAEITTFAPSAVVGQAVELTKEQKAAVYAVEARKDKVKLQIGESEAKKFGLLCALREIEAQAVALALDIAKAHGIDNADTSKGWDFNAEHCTITRTK